MFALEAARTLEGDLPLVCMGKSAGLLGGLLYLPRLPPPTLDNVSLSPLGTGSEVGRLIPPKQLDSSAAGAAQSSTAQDDQGSAPMEVEKDTGGVRHHKAEQYLPKIPMLAFDKMTTRANEINYWSEFVESVNSWLALLDDFYPIELYRATITDHVVRQDSLEKGPAARSARFHHLLRQSLGTFQRGLDIVRQLDKQNKSSLELLVAMKLSESSTWSTVAPVVESAHVRPPSLPASSTLDWETAPSLNGGAQRGQSGGAFRET